MPAPMCYNHAVGAPARSDALAEAYRSGHNEAVLKTVWVQAHGGSNPSASATAEKCEPMRFAFFIAAAEAEHNNEPLRRKLIAYFLHKIMRRRVRRLAQQDAFARTTLKEECFLLFRTFLFRSPCLMANIPQHSTFCLRRASSSLKKFSARLSSHENHSERPLHSRQLGTGLLLAQRSVLGSPRSPAVLRGDPENPFV